MTVDVNPPAADRAEYIFAGGVGYDVKVRASTLIEWRWALRTPCDQIPRAIRPT